MERHFHLQLDNICISLIPIEKIGYLVGVLLETYHYLKNMKIYQLNLKNHYSVVNIMVETNMKLNIDKKLTILILLWILDKLIMLGLFLIFK